MTAKHLTYNQARQVRAKFAYDRNANLNMPVLLKTGAKLCRLPNVEKPNYMILGYAQDGRDVFSVLNELNIK